jgi:hypothetical protein
MGQRDNIAAQSANCQSPTERLDRTTSSGSKERDFLSDDRRRIESPKGACASVAVQGEGQRTMRALLILAGICFSANAFAQDATPKAATKPVKPKEPMGCKLVGTVKGTKLWAGDCVGPELRGTASETDTPPLIERATGAIPPGQK